MFDEESFTIFEDISTVKTAEKLVVRESQKKLSVQDAFRYEDTRHESIVPNKISYSPLPTEYPGFQAKKYDFELDVFQKVCLCALERNESVLVAAHTSSGKTAVAEYAIAMAIRDNQRVIYTSPIKALSNQKYRDLQVEFKDVGLMTGDVTLNPQASCLVMTTEILRNMLYKGSELLREVSWIIFDEIHYMRDRDRGVVWEETIILLPSTVRMVFLSATIPNASEFASWVSETHSQVVHVVYTEKRPTPLTHYVVPKGGRGLYKVKAHDNKRGKDIFDKGSFSKAMRMLGNKRRVEEGDVQNVIRILVEQKCLPSVVFSFSRKECEKFALAVENDFLAEIEKEKVKKIFYDSLSSLRREDRDLPLIQNLLPLLLRGIGIHHSGLLPILKEIVEILFQENLLKMLFATETFSIGLNMPARSVIFTALKKFDGSERRIVSSGEYIQMSGRAGRRGIDTKGIVIVMLGDMLTVSEGARVFSGEPDKLNSAFCLSYNMVLNLMRVEGLDPLYMLSRSFFHFQKLNERTELESVLEKLYEKIPKEPMHGQEYFRLYQKRNQLKVEWTKEIAKELAREKSISLVTKGTVVDIFYLKDGVPYYVRNAVVSEFSAEKIDCCFFINGGIVKHTFPADSIDRVYKGTAKVETKTFFRRFEPVKLISCLDREIEKVENEISKNRNFVPFDACLLCQELSKSCIRSCRFVDALSRYIHSEPNEMLDEGKNGFFDTFFCPHPNPLVEFYRIEKMKSIYDKKHKEYQRLVEIYHMDECQKMIRVLKRLEYCDENSVLEKGQIACEISSGDELILTEMIFNGEFSKMNIVDIVSLLSCFVFEEWQSEEVTVSEESLEKYKILKNTAERIVSVLLDCNLDVDSRSYVRKFSYEMMDVVKMWVCGDTFLDICNKTSIFEGSIIRCFRRLEELLRQMCSAARVIGNTELENLFAIGITKIKRDIVFAGSLYL